MNSWNDTGFNGEEQRVYERIADDLYQIFWEAMLTAANSIIKKC